MRNPESAIVEKSVVLDGWLPRHRFNVNEYERMREFGILKLGDRVELLDGLIVDQCGAAISMRESQAMAAAPDSWVPFHRFSVDEYYRMAEIALLNPDARVELVEGEIIDMPPIGSPHCSTVDTLAEFFHASVVGRAIVRTQGVLRLSDYSEPQPDIALLVRRGDRYYHAHPNAAQTLLVVEVSQSSLRVDQKVKVPLFAHFGVPEVWVVDLTCKRLHFYRGLRSGEYTDVSSTAKTGMMPISSLPGAMLDLTLLFQ